MRVVLQRVKRAAVEVDGAPVSSISSGLLCLVGLREGDTKKDADFICRKILRTKVWPGRESGKAWDEDVTASGREVLLVSQFTLYGRLKKPKPDFSKAMPPQAAKEFYLAFVDQMRQEYDVDKVKDGMFGAMMDVSLVNDGPVTFSIDSDVDGPQAQLQ